MNSNLQLSPHFQLKEFIESPKARLYGIDNSPSPEVVNNLRRLCEGTLEPLHEAMGLPLVITSGYRCKALNKHIVHHSRKSQHVEGQAVDFKVQCSTPREQLILAFKTIITDPTIDYDLLILYPTFIHVSYVSRERNRRKLAKAFDNGTYAALTRIQALELN